MNVRGLMTAAFVVLATGFLIASPSEQRAATLMQAAQVKETIQNDLEGAVSLYLQAAAEPGARRETVARALLAAGLAQEKGRTADARSTFERIVRDFGDQKEVSLAAARRLGTLVARRTQSGAITARRVLNLESSDVVHSFSADGRLALGRRSQAPAQLFLVDLQTGQRTDLGVDGSNPLLSPDGARIAYLAGADRELRIQSATPGAKPQTIVAGGAPSPAAWTPDGKSILGMTISGGTGGRRTGPDPQQRTWMSVALADGTVTTIRAFEPGRFVSHPVLSPDGQFIAFAMSSYPENHQVYVSDSAGRQETLVSMVAGPNTRPVWTPDGGHLLFVNSRAVDELWAVPVQGGRAVGSAVRLSQSLNSEYANWIGALTLSRAGTLYEFRYVSNAPSLLIADRSASSAIRGLVPGDNPSLSPDGRTLAFVRDRADRFDLIVRSLETGAERVVPNVDVRQLSVRWLHDGSGFVALLGNDAGGTFSLVNATTFVVTPLFSRNTSDGMRSEVAALSHDDRTLFLLRGGKTARDPWTGIVGVDLATGAERQVLRFAGEGLSDAGLSLSPDGRTLAIMARVVGGSTDAHLFTVGVDGSEFRELTAPFHANRVVDLMQWTPDGQSIVFVAANRDGVGWKTMRVPSGGGAAEFDGLSSVAPTGSINLPKLGPLGPFALKLGPDGSRLIISARVQAGNEVWAHENVLSTLQGR